MKKNKVLLVIPSLQPGGMERVMAELAGYFVRRGDLEVHLLLYGRTRTIFYSVPDVVKVHLPSFPFDDSRRIWSTLKSLWFVRTKTREIHPDTVLSFGEYWNSFVLLATFGLGYPVYVSDRCQPDKPLGYLHDRLRRWLYPRATGVIAQTEKAKSIFRSAYRHSNMRVIGNPVRSMGMPFPRQRQNVVLSVGRLIDTKHHDRLIEMFATLRMPGWKLVIVGGDALKQRNKERLEKLISVLDVKDNVILTGSQSNVEQYYLSSKIFAFTSSSEGFPNVIGEAMAAGLPVVAYDCVAGPSEMVSDGRSGFLIPLFDEEKFCSALRVLMENDGLREEMGRAARKDISIFDIERVGEQFYNTIVLHEGASDKYDCQYGQYRPNR